MKKIIIAPIVILIVLFNAALAQNANNHKEMSEKYYAQKIAFISNELSLTPEESTAFWPLYNEYNDQKDVLHTEMMKYRRSLNGTYESLSENEALEALLFYQEHITAVQALEISYQNKYLKVLPANKVLLLLKAEKDFRRQLLKRLGKRRGQY
ncbi:MAG: hypothetical protein B7C24_05495 [Bacteroidetes bacterium 4572_77]|nr:MAG: hypothetical protein B7C24_05495 [Bacteroidetes bacterium 4572_77]